MNNIAQFINLHGNFSNNIPYTVHSWGNPLGAHLSMGNLRNALCTSQLSEWEGDKDLSRVTIWVWGRSLAWNRLYLFWPRTGISRWPWRGLWLPLRQGTFAWSKLRIWLNNWVTRRERFSLHQQKDEMARSASTTIAGEADKARLRLRSRSWILRRDDEMKADEMKAYEMETDQRRDELMRRMHKPTSRRTNNDWVFLAGQIPF